MVCFLLCFIRKIYIVTVYKTITWKETKIDITLSTFIFLAVCGDRLCGLVARVRFPARQDFLTSSLSGTGSHSASLSITEELLEWKK
jgi:hypothetical protein